MAASGLGVFFSIAFVGMMDGMLKDASERVDRMGVGHLQVSAAGYRLDPDPARVLADPAAVRARLSLPAGTRGSARLVSPGLLTGARGSRGVEILGVDPVAEAGVAEAIRSVVAGEPLSPDDARGVLVGKKVADKLRLKPGSSVRLTVQRSDGELGAGLFRVRGLFGGVAPSLSGSLVYLTTAGAERLLGVNDVAHQLVFQLPDGRQAEALAPTLRAAAGEGTEVLTLGELIPAWRSLQRLMDVLTFSLIVVVYLMVALGILNVMLMSVLERTREFGVMMAIGTRPGQVVSQVLWEAVWIATVAVGLGLAAGLAVNAYGERYGLLDYSRAFGEIYEMGGMAMSMKLRSAFSVPRALEIAALIWTITVAVGLYPAWRVSRLRPADAMRAR